MPSTTEANNTGATTLYHHQQRLLDRDPDQELLCWGTGTGKTRGSILWAMQQGGEHARNVLVVCPKALKKQWRRSVEEVDSDGVCQWSVYTKEEFKRDWKKIKDHGVLIVDEAHYFAGMRNARSISQMAKAMYSYVKHNDPKRLFLTATPYLSTPYNIFMLAKHLGHEWHYRRFKDRFFTERRLGQRLIPVVRENIEDEIAELVADIGDVVHIEECADIPEQVFEVEYFEENARQKKARADIFEVNPVVRFTKYHQIEQGTVKSDGISEDVFMDVDKTDRIVELAETNKKLAVVCRYNLQIDLYRELLEKKLDKPVLVIRGDVKNRDEIVQQAEEADEVVVLINAMCSEGYELPSIGLCVFASLSFSYKDRKQMIGRFLRLNKLKKNVYIDLLGGEIDEAVHAAIMRKQDFDAAIYERERNEE